MGIIHKSVPISSLSLLPPQERTLYFDKLGSMPANIQQMIFSPQTGAFIRGLTKTHNLPLEKSPLIALATVRVAFGEKSLAHLASILSTDLQIANDKAQQIATEIERELFTPIMLEYNKYVVQQRYKPNVAPHLSSGGARNVLDLKKQSPRPIPPPIPR